MKKIIAPIFLLLLLGLPFVLAAPDFNAPLDAADQQALDKIILSKKGYLSRSYIIQVARILRQLFILPRLLFV